MSSQDSESLQARYVFPVDEPPIAEGRLTWRGDRIESIGRPPAGAPAPPIEDVAILPALVNVHTHLEFSDLEQPLGVAGLPMPEWIKLVVERRRHVVSGSIGESDRATDHAIQRGLLESRRSGTALLGEIATSHSSVALSSDTPWSVCFRELMAWAPEEIDQQLTVAEDYLSRASGSAGEKERLGLSPHAPYTACLDLVEQVADLSRRRAVPLAMHLAESREEMEFLRSASGPLADLLRATGRWRPEAYRARPTISDYLTRLGQAHRCIVVHGNFLSDAEWSFLGEHRASMSVAYCPRTHYFFGHPDYPLSAALRAGVRVAFGTDSRASNPDLRLWEEMRAAAKLHPEVARSRILEAGTISGAEALGQGDDRGTLTPGKRADFVVVGPLGDVGDDPASSLFDGSARVRAVFQGGRMIAPQC